MIDAFFTSGRVADLVLVVMAIEVLIIYILMRHGRISIPFKTYFFGVIAGAFIILALRLALTDSAIATIALVLILSFAAHVFELFSFLRRKNDDPNYMSFSYKFWSNRGTTIEKDPK